MVIMMVALAVVASACKSQSDNEPDDIQFVSLTARVVNQYVGFAYVAFDAVVRVKTSAATMVDAVIYQGSFHAGVTADIPSTAGKWIDVTITQTSNSYSGTFEIRGEFTLLSTGKMVTGTCTLVVK